MTEQDEEAPSAIWLTLPGRVQFDYEVAAKSNPLLGSAEVIGRLVDQQKSLNKQFSTLYVISVLMAFFLYGLIETSDGPILSVDIIGFQITNIEFVAISFILSSVYGAMIYRAMSMYTNSKLIFGASSLNFNGQDDFTPFLFDAGSVWSHGLRIKSVGYSSGRLHYLISFFYIVFSALFIVAVFVLCASATYIVAMSVGGGGAVLILIAYLSAASVTLMTVFALVYFFVPFKFELRATETD